RNCRSRCNARRNRSRAIQAAVDRLQHLACPMLKPVDGKDTDPRLMEALMFEDRRRLWERNLIFVAAFAAGCSAAGHPNPVVDGGDADLSSPCGPGPGADLAVGTTGSGERIDDLDQCSASIKKIGPQAP